MATCGPVSEDPAYQRYDPGWKTEAPPFDARYPHQNQRSNCLRNYLDYHRCIKVMGEDFINCSYFKKVYSKKCPAHLVEKFDELAEVGALPYKF